MKKLLCIATALVICLFSISLTSCKNGKIAKADKNIENAVAGLSFPQTLNDGSKLTDCTYIDKVLTFTCDVDKKTFKEVKKDGYKEKTLERLKSGLYPRNLIDNVVAAEASIKYIFTNGDDSVEFTFFPDDLKLVED